MTIECSSMSLSYEMMPASKLELKKARLSDTRLNDKKKWISDMQEMKE
jgi:hypothetical protein